MPALSVSRGGRAAASRGALVLAGPPATAPWGAYSTLGGWPGAAGSTVAWCTGTAKPWGGPAAAKTTWSGAPPGSANRQVPGMLPTAVPVPEAPPAWLIALCSVRYCLLHCCSGGSGPREERPQSQPAVWSSNKHAVQFREPQTTPTECDRHRLLHGLILRLSNV